MESLRRLLLPLFAFFALTAQAREFWTDQYDVVWDSPSRDVHGNMPVGAGDMACNVWVEAAMGDLMFYVQRSGSFTEIGEHIKLGRVRLTLEPNPFKTPEDFEQRLKLEDSYISIRSTGIGEANFETRVRLWVDQFTHSVHVAVDADESESLIQIDEPYLTAEKKAYYREMRGRIPELPYGELERHRVMFPAEGMKPSKSSEAPQFYPLFPYDRFTVLDDEMEVFHNVWEYDTTMRRSSGGWNQIGIFLARMGLSREALEYHK